MKILVVTQKIDMADDDLGFFNDWLTKLANHADLLVIANQVGVFSLPSNVSVYSLGKEKAAGKIVKLYNYQKLLWKLLPQVDGVFFHMCTEYVLTASFLIKFFRKRCLLWYAHKNVSWKLLVASWLVNKIFTPSKESCRLKNTDKIQITGHGIDVEKFNLKINTPSNNRGVFNIISVGRIAPVKNIHILLETAEILKKNNFNFVFRIAGSPIVEKDKSYYHELMEKLRRNKLENYFSFVGKIPNKDIVPFYHSGDLFINLSSTGSLDKAVLEAMSCGVKVLTSNEAFESILLAQYFTTNDPSEIAEKVITLSKNSVDPSLRKIVENNHNLNNVVLRITVFLNC